MHDRLKFRVDVVQRMDFDTYDYILRELGERRDPFEWVNTPDRLGTKSWQELREDAKKGIDGNSLSSDELIGKLESAKNKEDFVTAVRRANYIEVDDDGDGMSMEILKDVYLTIGTSHRARQQESEFAGGGSRRRANSEGRQVILGEKGLGRLSAMRLGDAMEVVTGCVGAEHWNVLQIDWNEFANSADDDIGSISITPEKGDEKEYGVQGTVVRIFSLSSAWSEHKLERLAREDFSKVVDPFSNIKLPLIIHFNGVRIEIPAFASFILEHAHGVFTATYDVSKGKEPRLSGKMNYRLRNRQLSFNYEGAEVAEMAGGVSREALRRIGSFTLEVYWFNRRILRKIEGIGDLAAVRRLLATWAGGVALYRDGYRVNPYGGPNDDWLDLDKRAFSTSGFKLNRGQIVGRANITKEGNPYLSDQTNREGLTDGVERGVFVALLAATMEFFRGFVVDVDAEIRRSERVGAEDVLHRFKTEDDRIEEILPELIRMLSSTPGGVELSRKVKESLTSLREAAKLVEAASTAQEEERGRVMHLASIGLLIEVLAHELYRATAGGLKTIAAAKRTKDWRTVSVSLRVLDAQLRTLQKRLKVLDPLSTNARQTKETFELVEWIREIVDGYAAQKRQSNIIFRTVIDPRGATRRIKAVKGMFVQIVENLLSNSVHWIIQKEKYDRGPRGDRNENERIGLIEVSVEPQAGRVIVTDDGPGIPDDRRELVFRPFYTTKRQKQGRGLGLYIAREIAEYHGGTLTLGDADENGNINSVVLELGSVDGD